MHAVSCRALCPAELSLYWWLIPVLHLFIPDAEAAPVQVGIIGLKYTGKTTLFNAITGSQRATGQGGVDPHRAVGAVPDPRLDRLSAMFRPRRQVNAQIEWTDIPGFDPGVTADGGRAATRFLEHGRRMDALVQVIRCFDGGFGPANPFAEMDTLALEATLADLEIVERRLERLARDRRRMGKRLPALEPELMERFREQLEAGRPLRDLPLTPDERSLVLGYSFLTLKPLITVLNHGEGEELPAAVVERAHQDAVAVVALSAAIEEELAVLPPDEVREFLHALGIAEPAVARMIRAAYAALDLTSFFTVGADECRAWRVRRGTRAPQAAGVIHSDMERGFIRAEVVAYDALIAAGSLAAAREAGRLRLEGKTYEIEDGDVVEVRFNV